MAEDAELLPLLGGRSRGELEVVFYQLVRLFPKQHAERFRPLALRRRLGIDSFPWRSNSQFQSKGLREGCASARPQGAQKIQPKNQGGLSAESTIATNHIKHITGGNISSSQMPFG